MKRFLLLMIMAAGLASVSQATPGVDAPQPVGAYLNGKFPQTTPGPSGNWGIADAFPNLTFIDPVRMVKDPLSNAYVYVICRNGEIWRIPFSSSATSAQKVRFLDRKANTWGYWDTGMLSLSFHPDYGKAGSPNRGYVYVFYQYIPAPITNQTVSSPSYMRLSRFNVPDGATAVDPASEYVMIQQYDRHNWHGGGSTFFGPDGFLYLVIGDEGDANDSHGITQKIDSRLFSGILRIDVDRNPLKSHPIRRQPQQITMPTGWAQSFTQGYYIPNDNPWQDPSGGILEEFWSVGTRSPYSMHFDKGTGDIWIAEVGQGTREEITIAKKGGNHQWPYKEGLANGPKAKPSVLIGEDNPPVYDYGRSMGGCIIGGVVYRGSTHSGSLTGKYIFGDHNTKAIYALNRTEGGTATAEYLTSVNRSGGTKAGLSGISEGPDGELYLTELGNTGADTGKIYKLVRTGSVVADPPALLSQTGAFSNLSTLTPVPGLLPYGVNSPLWTDGSAKQRWIALPNDGTHNTAAERITYSENGPWTFPPGTVLVKHFALPVDERNPSIVKPLETRFFVHGSNGTYYGVTYKWNEAGTDAELMTTGGSRTMTVTKTDGTTRTQRWDFPSRSDCRTCHSSSSDNVLGVRSHQLAGDFLYPSTGRTSNQLETWNVLGMFGTSFGSRNPATLPRSVDPHNPHASLDHRVKSYIDSNCSHCHQPDGVSANFDASFNTPLFSQGLIRGLINHPINGMTDRVVEPGDVSRSLLHGRLSVTGANQMPPLGKNVVDAKAVALVEDWIRSLDGAEFPDASAGIKGEYFSGRNFESRVFTRIDSKIDFNWGTGSAGTGLGQDDFSVRWQGKLIPPATGSYTLYATGDDGIRVKVNGTTLINAWSVPTPTEYSATVSLTAGQAVDLIVEYFDGTGAARASLSWAGPGITKTIVPASAFRLAETFNDTPLARNDSFTVTHGATTSLDVLANDHDGDAPLGIHGVAITTPPSHGQIRIDGAGKRLIYTHNGTRTTTDSFSYTVTDPEGFTSGTAVVNLTIPYDFAAWASGTSGAGSTPTANGDGDLYTDLLEFALGSSPASGAFTNGDPITLEADTSGSMSVKIRRPTQLSGLTYQLLTSPDLAAWTIAPAPTITPAGTGFETLAFLNLQSLPGLSVDRGFARLKVIHTASGTSSMTLPLGWQVAPLGPGTHTLGVPFREVVFSSKVVSTTSGKLTVMGNPPSGSSYVEVITGTNAGRTYAISSITTNQIQLTGSSIPDLTGAGIVVCANHTVGEIFRKELLKGSTNPGSADQIQLHVNDGISPGKFELFYLLDARPGNTTHQWRAFVPGGGDQAGRVIPPGAGVFVKRPAGVPVARLLLKGQVRGNPFRPTLRQGINLLSSPFPLSLTPRQWGMCDTTSGFTPSTNINNADQFQILNNGSFRIFYLLDHPTLPDPWRETVPGTTDYSDTPLFGPHGAAFLKRGQPTTSHLIPLPWNP